MEHSGYSQSTLNRYLYILVGSWTVIFVILLGFIATEIESNARHHAFIRARSVVERDVLYRQWAAEHGGVYVPVSEDVQPNPHLSFVHNRDIVTTDGEILTLVNPAAMTRQVYELSNRHSQIINRITSLDLMNRDNAPDTWEATALMELSETGADAFSALVDKNGVDYARTIVPLRTEAGCLECHFDQGYKVGDIRGGISVMVPFAPFLDEEWAASLHMLIMATLLWLAGLIFILVFSGKLKQQLVFIRESERQRNIAESTLHYLAHFDKKTNLPNRALFDDRLGQSIVHAERLMTKVAVAVVQIDNFTKICDTFTHSVEDVLIRKFAEVVGACIRPDDSVARFEKDSLLILLPGILAKENIARIVDKINSRLEKTITIEGHEVFINASFGVALYPDDTTDAENLVRFAETAAERACSLERTNLQMYSTELNEMAHEQLFLETALRKALQEEQFTIYYQPQVDAPSGRVTGAEALIRWFHPEKGMITPDRFIPLAENNGMIFPIGEWIMLNACRQAAAWQKELDRSFQIGINVSAKQFADPHLIDMIDRALTETGLPAENLEIEITEGMIMADVERAIETLIDLKVRGIKIAIDDFGTGYSSLSQLKKFPIDRLKIDRSFVSELGLQQDDKVIVEMIIELTGKLNLSVIAEGVENKEQKDFLVSRGCYQMQGFFFSRPVPPGEFGTVLARCA